MLDDCQGAILLLVFLGQIVPSVSRQSFGRVAGPGQEQWPEARFPGWLIDEADEFVQRQCFAIPVVGPLQAAAGFEWWKASCPVEPAVADGLAQVGRPDVRFAGQIGDGAGHPQDAVGGTGGQAKAFDGGLQQMASFLV